MNHSQFFLVIANSAQAKLFRGASPTGTLEEFSELTNDAAQMQEEDVVTHKAGRRHDNGMGHRSAMERDPVEHEVDDFAKTVASQLEQLRTSGELHSLSVVAEPQFLGKLRGELTPSLRDIVLEEVAKNVAGQPVEQVQDKHLTVLH